MSDTLRFAHLSDWHATTLVGAGRSLWPPKRLSGWASWRLGRRQRHSDAVLAAAFRDVQAQGVDRILVTGDLTHVSLEQEFATAADQLATLGPPERIFLVPGNHDCYVPVPPERSWDLWTDYLVGLDPVGIDAELAACLAPRRPAGQAPRHADYPTLRQHGRVAMIGLCSAIPTPIFRAGGRLGGEQLDRLERLLSLLGERGSCRIVLLHHPVAAEGEPVRRALWDRSELAAVLARAGAELVLHGHKHRRRINWLPGPEHRVPVIGVPSSSEVGSRPGKLAQYHLYTVRPAASGAGFEIEPQVRGYEPRTGEFGAVDDVLF